MNNNINYLSMIPTEQSVSSGSNLPAVLRQLSSQPNTINQANILQAAQQAYQNAAGGDNNNSKGNSWLNNLFGGSSDPAQPGLDNANAAFGTYDPASMGLSNANDAFGSFGGLDAAGAMDAGAGAGAMDMGAGADMGMAALFA